MKKITSIIVLVFLLLTSTLFTACSSEAETLINEALRNTDKLDAYEVSLTIEVNTALFTIPMDVDLKVIDAQSDSPTMLATVFIETLGKNEQLELYTTGDWTYITSPGGKSKVKRSSTTSQKYDYTNDIEDILQDFPHEVLKGAKAVDQKDGSQKVSLSIPDEVFVEVFDDLLSTIYITVTDDYTLQEFQVSNAKTDITVRNGYVSNYDINFDMTLSINKVEATAAVSANLRYESIGNDVKILPPVGYESFSQAS